MRTLIIVLFLIHGCIHFIGFSKIFGYSTQGFSTQIVSKPFGMAWLMIGLLLISTGLLLFFKKEWWPVLGLIVILLSQILIVVYWKDAKFGTIINVILFIYSLSAYGNFTFNQMIQKESAQILEPIVSKTPVYPESDELKQLPPIVQKWLINSGAMHSDRAISIRLKQKGKLKTSPSSKWMPFAAHQYFNCNEPAFLWVTKVNPLPLVYLVGRDKLINAEGEMLIKLFALFPVVHEGQNEKINAASMQRYLAEMCWFPSAALNDYLTWETIDETSVKAIFTLDKKSVSGIFTFSLEGEFKSFETKRYYGSGKDAALEDWYIEALDYKVFNDIKIPSNCQVTWKLEEGDFTWLKLEIIALDYNIPSLYE